MARRNRFGRLILFVSCVAIVAGGGCARGRAREKRVPYDEIGLTQRATREVEGRAIWVTRWDYKTADDVKKIIDNIADARFNMAMFQVRGNGTAFYKSSHEPWAWELTSSGPLTTGQDPGFDPLEVAIARARKRGIELHAYMNVLPAWRGKRFPPYTADQLWTLHPEWFMVDRKGEKMIPRDAEFGDKETFYACISPGIPEVREYTVSVFREVANKYDVDGIHLDYIRYPHEVGDFSYDPVSLEHFEKATGETPEEDPEAWTLWRGQQVSAIVSRIHEDVKRVAPHALVSASVMFDMARARDEAMQRGGEWMRDGTVDAVFPMIYKKSNEQVAQSVTQYLHAGRGGMVFAGLMVLDDAAQLIDQIDIARAAGAHGVSLFAYSNLFPQHEPKEIVKALKNGPFGYKARVPTLPKEREPEPTTILTGIGDEPAR